jgi:hypothetical protein
MNETMKRTKVFLMRTQALMLLISLNDELPDNGHWRLNRYGGGWRGGTTWMGEYKSPLHQESLSNKHELFTFDFGPEKIKLFEGIA